MAARTSIIDESADDGVPADFWNEVLDSFEVMDEWAEGSEEAKKAAEERARKKKEDELEKVRKFNEAWNIAPAAEEEVTRIEVDKTTTESETTPVVESTTSAVESDSRSKSPDCAIINEEREVITVEEDNIHVAENSVVVIPAEGLPKDPRLKRIEEASRVQSPSSPTQEARTGFTERELAPSNRYFQVDRDREREEQIRKDREDFERARSRLRSRSPGARTRRSMSDDEDDIGRPFPRHTERSRSRYRSRSREHTSRRSRSPRRAKSSRRSRSRSRDRVRSRRSTRSRSRSRSRPRRDLTDELRDRLTQSGSENPAAMMNQMTSMMQMMMDPSKMMSMNPMMAMMMQMNPMMAAAAAAAAQRTADTAKETPVAEQPDKKDDITAQLFLDSKINLSDFLATRSPIEGKKSTRANLRVVQRIKEAITILDKQETKQQTAKFLYVAPTYHTDLKKLDNRSPLIWNDQNVLYSSTSKSKDVGLCEPFRNINRKMKQMIERLGLDEGNISQRIANQKKEKTSTQSGADVGTIQAITIVPVRGGASSKRMIERSIQTEDFNCLDCVQRRSKTYVSVNTQTAIRARTIEVSVQTERDRDVELHSMNDLNANQVKILNEIMRYMKKRQVSGNMTNLMNNLERDVPELRNQHLNAGLHYVSEIMEQNERNANRYAGPNPMNPKAREMAIRQGGGSSRDPRARGSFKDEHHGVNFDEINKLTTSMVPAGFRPSPPRRTNNSGSYNKRRAW
ncbi:uncharacterized protein LOC134225854 [Armigeres subalbatus]|uniref:uncharacterized protein LOC134225854 n=1 Tax=Armigeres subalbatus TaxID=124917 RepID=UPI002ED24738